MTPKDPVVGPADGRPGQNIMIYKGLEITRVLSQEFAGEFKAGEPWPGQRLAELAFRFMKPEEILEEKAWKRRHLPTWRILSIKIILRDSTFQRQVIHLPSKKAAISKGNVWGVFSLDTQKIIMYIHFT